MDNQPKLAIVEKVVVPADWDTVSAGHLPKVPGPIVVDSEPRAFAWEAAFSLVVVGEIFAGDFAASDIVHSKLAVETCWFACSAIVNWCIQL